MDAAWDNLIRLGRLVFPALLGFIAARATLFPSTQRAVTVLNTYALYIGFPALITFGLANASLALPDQVMFYALWPLALLLILLGVAVFGRDQRGTLALMAGFGNIAYLGLPLAIATMGPSIEGAGSLAVSLHVALAVTLGAGLLEHWGGANTSLGKILSGLLKLPLFWAPFVGLLARMMPDGARVEFALTIQPLAKSAAPVALFLLGLHLYQERARFTRITAAQGWHVALCLLIKPTVVLGLCLMTVAMGWLDRELAMLHVLLAGMPAAIATFAMAHRAGIGAECAAGTVVWSTLLAALSVPLWTTLAQYLFG